MSESIEVLESRLAALRKAHASGVLLVRHGDTQLQYRSLAEIEQAINSILKQIAALQGRPRKVGYVRQSGRGL